MTVCEHCKDYVDRVTEKLLDRDLRIIELQRKFEAAVNLATRFGQQLVRNNGKDPEYSDVKKRVLATLVDTPDSSPALSSK